MTFGHLSFNKSGIRTLSYFNFLTISMIYGHPSFLNFTAFVGHLSFLRLICGWNCQFGLWHSISWWDWLFNQITITRPIDIFIMFSSKWLLLINRWYWLWMWNYWMCILKMWCKLWTTPSSTLINKFDSSTPYIEIDMLNRKSTLGWDLCCW